MVAVGVLMVGSALGVLAPAHAEVDTDAYPFTLLHPQSLYAYVTAGETIKYDVSAGAVVATSTTDALGVTIAGPGGASQSKVISLAQATSAGNGTYSAPTTGVYRIALNTADAASGAINDDGLGSNSSGNYFARRISLQLGVSDGNDDISGRIWSNGLTIYNNSVIDNPLRLYYLSDTGYVYRAEHFGFGGVEATFAADAYGVVKTGTCTSAYRSVSTYSDDYELANPQTCLGRYRVFIDGAPNSDMPTTAEWFDGRTSNDWVNPSTATPSVTIDSVKFAHNSTSVATIAATIKHYAGQVEVRVTDNHDNLLRDYQYGLDGAGPDYVIPFDGNDADGKPIPSSVPLTFTVYANHPGEIHFISSDVETRAGITVTALNGPNAGKSGLNWNDSFLAQVTRNGVSGATPELVGQDVDSAASDDVHGWPCLNSSGDATSSPSQCNADSPTQPKDVRYSWGDRTLIEDWTFIPTDSHDATDIDAAPVATDGTIDGVHPGDAVTFTVVDLDADGNPRDGSLVTSPRDPAPTIGLNQSDGSVGDTLKVTNEGTWKVDGDKITFTPEPGFVGDPTPVSYTVWNSYGRSSTATLSISVVGGSPSPSSTASPSSSVSPSGAVSPSSTPSSVPQAGAGGDTSSPSPLKPASGTTASSDSSDSLAATGAQVPAIAMITAFVALMLGAGLLVASRIRASKNR